MARFNDVTPQVNLPEMEQGVLGFWRKAGVFSKTVEQHKDGPRYVFYEGPPTANGRPGIHHVLARAFKDIFPRYKTMRGYFVSRKGGWDTHGLPVELEIERKLGFSGKKAIEEYGVSEFNKLCRQSVFDYVEDWEKLTERMAFWVDLPTAYRTYTNDYVESLWWILKQYWDRGLIYQGYKVVPYCPRCGTPLSSHELAQGYQEGTKDPSIFVKFPVKDQPGVYLLVWTTTPWTLPGNVAVAAGEEVDYVLVQHDDDQLWLAEALVDTVFAGHADHVEVLRRVKGKELLGLHYRPLYTFLPVLQDYCYVVPGDFVSTEDGTGLVHIAPAYGADDMEVGRKFGLPTLMTVDAQGRFTEEVEPWRGIFVKDADPLIQRELTERGLMFKQGIYEHTYPFCWRCDTPLLYYARTTWYIKTTAFKDRLVANNQRINWVPDHIRDGRFGEWLENNIDWGLARERYWGTPLPFWVCDNPKCGHQECIGSVAELGEKTGRRFMNPRYLAQQLGRWPDVNQPDTEPLDLHRPAVDVLTWTCAKCGTGEMHRVREVADAWFDSGSMPVAQWHYPFENQEVFAEQFPADYICEAIDQTRGWFYTLHAVSTLLFDSVAFKNVICLGHIVAEDGGKMSKSRGNVINPWTVMDLHGADATRWYMYTASPPGNTRRFSANLVKEIVGRFMLTLWNSYSFFVTYANLNDFDPKRDAGAARSAIGARSVGVGAAAPPRDRRDAGPRDLRRHRLDPADQRVRRRAEQLVRAAQPQAVLERGTGRGEPAAQPGRAPDDVRGAGDVGAPARAVHAVHRGRDLLQPGNGGRRGRERASQPLARPEPASPGRPAGGRHGPGPEGGRPRPRGAESAAPQAATAAPGGVRRRAQQGRGGGGPPHGRRGGEGRTQRQGAAPGGRGQRPGRRADPPLPKQLGQKHGRKFPAIRAALLALEPMAVAAAVEAGIASPSRSTASASRCCRTRCRCARRRSRAWPSARRAATWSR